MKASTTKTYPSFGRNIVVAAGMTLLGVLALSFSPAVIGLYLMGFAYLCYTLHLSPRSTGRVALLAAWLVGVFALSLLDAAWTTVLLFNIAHLWVARCWCHLDTVLQALSDVVLWVGALGLASIALLHSGSYPLAIWTFFLVQALWPWLAKQAGGWTLNSTDSSKTNQPSDNNQQQNAFNDAKNNAETALRRLQTPASS